MYLSIPMSLPKGRLVLGNLLLLRLPRCARDAAAELRYNIKPDTAALNGPISRTPGTATQTGRSMSIASSRTVTALFVEGRALLSRRFSYSRRPQLPKGLSIPVRARTEATAADRHCQGRIRLVWRSQASEYRGGIPKLRCERLNVSYD